MFYITCTQFTVDDFPQAALGVETPFFPALESEGLTSSKNDREMSNVKSAFRCKFLIRATLD